VPTIGGNQSEPREPVRVTVATTPAMPTTATAISATSKHRCANRPAAAAATTSTANTLSSSTGLSFVPNERTANSFNQRGTESMTRLPTAMIGSSTFVAAATSAATPSPAPRAMSPASEPQRRGRACWS
jgi:hypothetical protein